MSVNQIPVIMVENVSTNLTVLIVHVTVGGMDQPAAERVSFKRCDDWGSVRAKFRLCNVFQV